MKKTFYVLGMFALMATFTACNSETKQTENTDATKVENTEGAAKCGEGKCGEGKCGEGKCGGADEAGEKQDHFASMDTDGNGEISKDEFDAHVKKEVVEKDANGDGKLTADECGHFDKLNTDDDDFISEEEFKTGHEKMFNKMDADANGSISREEMEAQMKAMNEAATDKKCCDAAGAEEKCGEGKCGK